MNSRRDPNHKHGSTRAHPSCQTSFAILLFLVIASFPFNIAFLWTLATLVLRFLLFVWAAVVLVYAGKWMVDALLGVKDLPFVWWAELRRKREVRRRMEALLTPVNLGVGGRRRGSARASVRRSG